LRHATIAGDTLDHAVDTVRQLAARSCVSTVDILGEYITTCEQALSTRRA